MGEVWLGRHPDLDIPVAIKTLPPHLAVMGAGFDQRFITEARTAAKINHANVVRVYDAGDDDGVQYLVMELVEGGSVQDLLDENDGPLPPERAVAIALQVAHALAAAAKYGIVHRDIKPDNIMLDKDGTAKLSDLGLAKEIEGLDGPSLTGTGMAMGSPSYMAPEQAEDAKSVDVRADIYSLGASLYHMATGKVPFSGTSSLSVMLKHISEPLPDPREKNPALPENVCGIIRKMMAKKPDDRYQTADELVDDLELVSAASGRAIAGLPAGPATAAAEASADTEARADQRPWLYITVAGVVIALALVGVLLLVARRRPPPAAANAIPPPPGAANAIPPPPGSAPPTVAERREERPKPDPPAKRPSVRSKFKPPREWIEFAERRDKLPAAEQIVLIIDELKKYNRGREVTQKHKIEDDKIVTLDLRFNKELTSIAPLYGLPLTSLNLGHCSGLKGDLRALSGMELVNLNLNLCSKLKSLAGIESAQVTKLVLAFCHDLSSLDGIQELPLKQINLRACKKLGTRDYRMLEKIPSLESVSTGDKRRDQRILDATEQLHKKLGSESR